MTRAPHALGTPTVLFQLTVQPWGLGPEHAVVHYFDDYDKAKEYAAYAFPQEGFEFTLRRWTTNKRPCWVSGVQPKRRAPLPIGTASKEGE